MNTIPTYWLKKMRDTKLATNYIRLLLLTIRKTRVKQTSRQCLHHYWRTTKCFSSCLLSQAESSAFSTVHPPDNRINRLIGRKDKTVPLSAIDARSLYAKPRLIGITIYHTRKCESNTPIGYSNKRA